MSDNRHSSRRQFLMGTAAIFGGATLLPGCGGGGGTTIVAPLDPTTTRAVLGGGQQVPAVTSTGKGIAELIVNVAQTEITVSVNTSGLTGVTMAHIHAGSVGTNGPVIFPLYDAAQGAFPASLTKTLRAADLQAQPEARINTFQDAVNAVTSGGAYVNIHTAAHPDGEIRGQLGQITTYATLTGNGAVPAVPSAYGIFQGGLEPALTSMTLTLSVANLPNITGAEIRVGAGGTPGLKLFTLSTTNFGTQLTAAIANAELTPQPSAGISNFADFIDAMLAGRTFIVVNTQANPTGAIQGQLLFKRYSAALTVNGNLPVVGGGGTVTNPALALAIGTLNLAKDALALEVNLTGTTITNVTKIQIQAGAAGVAGPVVATIFDSAVNGTFTQAATKVIRAADIVPGGGIANFADFLTQLSAGNLYVNVLTAAAPTGALRGQLLG